MTSNLKDETIISFLHNDLRPGRKRKAVGPKRRGGKAAFIEKVHDGKIGPSVPHRDWIRDGRTPHNHFVPFDFGGRPHELSVRTRDGKALELAIPGYETATDLIE